MQQLSNAMLPSGNASLSQFLFSSYNELPSSFDFAHYDCEKIVTRNASL
jgi:hypothetical protein